MTSRNARTVGRWTHPVVATMLSTFGSAGLAAAAARPALLAAIDQHAAAVRDRLVPAEPDQPEPWPSRPVVHGALLAAYAVGVRDAAMDLGWRPPAEPVDWAEADWVLIRLLAVCALARDPHPTSAGATPSRAADRDRISDHDQLP